VEGSGFDEGVSPRGAGTINPAGLARCPKSGARGDGPRQKRARSASPAPTSGGPAGQAGSQSGPGPGPGARSEGRPGRDEAMASTAVGRWKGGAPDEFPVPAPRGREGSSVAPAPGSRGGRGLGPSLGVPGRGKRKRGERRAEDGRAEAAPAGPNFRLVPARARPARASGTICQPSRPRPPRPSAPAHGVSGGTSGPTRAGSSFGPVKGRQPPCQSSSAAPLRKRSARGRPPGSAAGAGPPRCCGPRGLPRAPRGTASLGGTESRGPPFPRLRRGAGRPGQCRAGPVAPAGNVNSGTAFPRPPAGKSEGHPHSDPSSDNEETAGFGRKRPTTSPASRNRDSSPSSLARLPPPRPEVGGPPPPEGEGWSVSAPRRFDVESRSGLGGKGGGPGSPAVPPAAEGMAPTNLGVPWERRLARRNSTVRARWCSNARGSG